MMELFSHFTDLGKHAMFIWLSWGAVVVALIVLALVSRASVTRRANEVASLKSEIREISGDEV